jgi:hypothetical protein
MVPYRVFGSHPPSSRKQGSHMIASPSIKWPSALQAQPATTVVLFKHQPAAAGRHRDPMASSAIRKRKGSSCVETWGWACVGWRKGADVLQRRIRQAPRWCCGATGWSGARAKAPAGCWLGVGWVLAGKKGVISRGGKDHGEPVYWGPRVDPGPGLTPWVCLLSMLSCSL